MSQLSSGRQTRNLLEKPRSEERHLRGTNNKRGDKKVALDVLLLRREKKKYLAATSQGKSTQGEPRLRKRDLVYFKGGEKINRRRLSKDAGTKNR